MVFELGIKGGVCKAIKVEEEETVYSRAVERVVRSVHDKYHYYTCTVSMVKAHEAGHAAGTWSRETLGFEGI